MNANFEKIGLGLIWLFPAWFLVLGSSGTAGGTQKIQTNFICVSSGNLEGKALDDRTECAVISVSSFHKKHDRLPNDVEELLDFCEIEAIETLDLVKIDAKMIENGQLKYSAVFRNGTLHLRHLPFKYVRSDQIQPFQFP